jgi:hypothetical protein
MGVFENVVLRRICLLKREEVLRDAVNDRIRSSLFFCRLHEALFLKAKRFL